MAHLLRRPAQKPGRLSTWRVAAVPRLRPFSSQSTYIKYIIADAKPALHHGPSMVVDVINSMRCPTRGSQFPICSQLTLSRKRQQRTMVTDSAWLKRQ